MMGVAMVCIYLESVYSGGVEDYQTLQGVYACARHWTALGTGYWEHSGSHQLLSLPGMVIHQIPESHLHLHHYFFSGITRACKKSFG
jgi:hypothetical protein